MQFYLGGKNKNSNIYNFFWDLKNNRDELLSQKSLYLENIDEFAVAEVFEESPFSVLIASIFSVIPLYILQNCVIDSIFSRDSIPVFAKTGHTS